MKLLYSQLKELLPGLKASPKEVGEKLTLAGLMLDGLSAVNYQGKSDWLLSLEVRQNRADCLGVLGLAKEVAAYYGLRFKLPVVRLPQPSQKKATAIRVEAKKQIKRARAYEMTGVTNRTSPAWLKEFLKLYGINSINLLVDLSNYVMLFTGFPSHLLDQDKMQGSLRWTMNKDFGSLTTLDGSVIKLNRDEIIIQDDQKILGLAGIVGGLAAAIDLKTHNVVAEMAIYDRVLVRRNARSLKITTEASVRLEKDLDPEGPNYALDLLISLILREGGGRVASAPFSYYPTKRPRPNILFDPASPSLLAGIPVSRVQALRILKRLRFNVDPGKGKFWRVIPPSDRLDVTIAEDVVEEVVRVIGYNRIPSDQPPAFRATTEITPLHIKLAERVRDTLTPLGFDEILSWPLTSKEMNRQTNYRPWIKISTQNSVNEECPDLRQSIGASLLLQLQEYQKRNLNQIRLFEIGKVFGQAGKRYSENDSLGLLLVAEKGRAVNRLRQVLETLLRSLGLSDLIYAPAKIRPAVSHPTASWDILVKDQPVGIIYKLAQSGPTAVALAEVDLNQLTQLSETFQLNPVRELTQKLVVLDANVELSKTRNIQEVLVRTAKLLGARLWSSEIVDAFALPDKIRYTLRVIYQGLSDEEAKAQHAKLFHLVKE